MNFFNTKSIEPATFVHVFDEAVERNLIKCVRELFKN